MKQSSSTKLRHEEEKVLREEKKIIEDEKKITAEEGKIVKEEKFLNQGVHDVLGIEKTLKDAARTRGVFLRRFAKHKFAFSMIAGIGVVLVWRGLWDISETIPGLESSLVALLVGVGILWFLEKYTEL